MSRLRFERCTSPTYVHCFDNLLSSSYSSAVSRNLMIIRKTSAEHGAPITDVSSLYQYWEQTPRDLYITKSFRDLSVSGRSLACSSGSTDVMNSLSLHNSHLKVSIPCEGRASAHPGSSVLTTAHNVYMKDAQTPGVYVVCRVGALCGASSDLLVPRI